MARRCRPRSASRVSAAERVRERLGARGSIDEVAWQRRPASRPQLEADRRSGSRRRGWSRRTCRRGPPPGRRARAVRHAPRARHHPSRHRNDQLDRVPIGRSSMETASRRRVSPRSPGPRNTRSRASLRSMGPPVASTSMSTRWGDRRARSRSAAETPARQRSPDGRLARSQQLRSRVSTSARQASTDAVVARGLIVPPASR